MADKEDLNAVGLENGPTAVEIRTYRDDQEIIAEGELSDRFYVVLSGQVRIGRRGRHLSTLREGDVFGLDCCLYNHPSNVGVRPVDEARIAAYGSEAIDFILYERPSMSKEILGSLLGQLGQTVKAAVREGSEAALDDVNIRFCEDGEVIIREGTRETDIFMLVSADRGLVVQKNGREMGRIQTPGEFFGEMASVLDQERTATITSEGKSVVQVYSAEHIQDMIEDHPEIAKKMIRSLAKRLSFAIKKIVRVQKELETHQRADS
jgi:CRP-like cAMP-binding protein